MKKKKVRQGWIGRLIAASLFFCAAIFIQKLAVFAVGAVCVISVESGEIVVIEGEQERTLPAAELVSLRLEKMGGSIQLSYTDEEGQEKKLSFVESQIRIEGDVESITIGGGLTEQIEIAKGAQVESLVDLAQGALEVRGRIVSATVDAAAKLHICKEAEIDSLFCRTPHEALIEGKIAKLTIQNTRAVYLETGAKIESLSADDTAGFLSVALGCEIASADVNSEVVVSGPGKDAVFPLDIPLWNEPAGSSTHYFSVTYWYNGRKECILPVRAGALAEKRRGVEWYCRETGARYDFNDPVEQDINLVLTEVENETELISAIAQGESAIYLKPGTYALSQSIVLASGQTLYLMGEQAENTKMIWPRNTNAFVLSDGEDAMPVREIQLGISGVEISVSGQGRGIQAGNLKNCEIELQAARILYDEGGRGISIGQDQGQVSQQNRILLQQSEILLREFTGASTESNRGISVYYSEQSQLVVRNSRIEAGHYALTLNSPGLAAVISGSVLKGLAAFNLHNQGSDIDVVKSALIGRTSWDEVYGAIAFDTCQNTRLTLARCAILNEYVGEADGYEAAVIMKRSGNVLKMDRRTMERTVTSNRDYAPEPMLIEGDNEWYIDGKLQDMPLIVDLYVNDQDGNDLSGNPSMPSGALRTVEEAVQRLIERSEGKGETGDYVIYVINGEKEDTATLAIEQAKKEGIFIAVTGAYSMLSH